MLRKILTSLAHRTLTYALVIFSIDRYTVDVRNFLNIGEKFE